VNGPPEDTPPSPLDIPKLLSKVEKKTWKAFEDGILHPKICLNIFKEALEEPEEDNDFDKHFGNLALPFKGVLELPLPSLETTFSPDSSEKLNFNGLFAEEPREEVKHVVSILPPIPSSCDLPTEVGPVGAIHLPPISTQPEPTLSLWDKQPADLLLTRVPSAVNGFIGNDDDFEAVDLTKSMALSHLGSNRDIPLERNALQDSCQPNVEFFMEFLEPENEIHVEWKDKNSGNRALRQP
jgi:hypothetical protein